MLWFWLLCIGLALVIFLLLVKIWLLRRAAKEIEREFAYSLLQDTNNLIAISSRDKAMRRLAGRINEELRLLRSERHRFRQGDLEMKEAITNLSHDLRTPLTAICGYLELLREEAQCPDMQPETLSRYLEIIDERTKRLRELTEELFSYTLASASPGVCERNEISINSVLEQCISACYGLLKERQIVPSVSIPDKKVLRRLDAKALARIFENILGNALKYSDGDLRVTLKESGEITFENHASRLDEVQISRLFHRFYTVESAHNSTGLGLSIARSLTEQMNGKIEAFYRDSVLEISVRFPEADKASPYRAESN